LKNVLTVLFSIPIILFGCSVHSSNSSKPPNITKNFVEKNAKEALTKEEVKDIFGEYSLAGEGEFDGNEVWLYDSVKNGFEYEKNLQRVPFDELRNGNVKYQLYINFVNDKVLTYLYIYKNEDGQLRNLQVNPDGSIQDTKN